MELKYDMESFRRQALGDHGSTCQYRHDVKTEAAPPIPSTSLGIIGDGSNLQDKIQEIPAPERRVQVFNWFRIFQPEQPAHPNEPFYYCPATSCAVPFSSHPELLEHIVMCAKLEEGSYYCQICSKDERFAWPKELQQQLPKRVYSCAKRTSKFIKRLRLPKLLIPSSPVIAPTSSAPTSSSTDASTQELDTQKTSSHFFASSHELESCKTTPWPSHSHELPAQLSKSQAETHLELTGSDVRMELPGYYTPAELPERRSQWEQIATRVHERIDPISRFVDDVQPSSKMSEVMLTEELPLLLDVDEQVSPVDYPSVPQGDDVVDMGRMIVHPANLSTEFLAHQATTTLYSHYTSGDVQPPSIQPLAIKPIKSSSFDEHGKTLTGSLCGTSEMLFEEFFKPIFEDLLPSARKINSKQALQSSFDFEEYTATTVLQEGLRTFGLYRQEYCARPQDYFITKLTAEQVYSLLFAACAMAMVWGHKSTAQIEHDLFKDLITWGKAINDYEERQAFAQVTKKLWSLSIDTQVDLAPQRASLHFQFTEYTKDCLNSEDMVEMSISLTTLMTGEISQMFVRFFDMIEYVQPSSQMISGGCQHQQCEEIFVISKDHFCGFVIDFMLRTESLAEPWISVVNDHAALRAKACETLRQYEVSLLNYGKERSKKGQSYQAFERAVHMACELARPEYSCEPLENYYLHDIQEMLRHIQQREWDARSAMMISTRRSSPAFSITPVPMTFRSEESSEMVESPTAMEPPCSAFRSPAQLFAGRSRPLNPSITSGSRTTHSERKSTYSGRMFSSTETDLTSTSLYSSQEHNPTPTNMVPKDFTLPKQTGRPRPPPPRRTSTIYSKQTSTSDGSCNQCGWQSRANKHKDRKGSLERHIAEQHNDTRFQCQHCPVSYQRSSTLLKHVRKKHEVSCQICQTKHLKQKIQAHVNECVSKRQI